MESQLNTSLNQYFHREVQLAETESEKYKKIAFTDIERIMEYIHQQDPRFSKEPIRAGSYWQGLKVDKADEYDLSVRIEGVGPLVWSSSSDQRYYGFDHLNEASTDTLSQNLEIVSMDIPLPSPPTGYMFTKSNPPWARKDDFMRQGDIVPFLVKRRLKELLTEAIRNLNLRGTVRQSRKAHGPALTLYITSGKRELSIDFAPYIRAGLPFESWIGWPRNTSWPSAEKVERIKQIGFGEVAKKDFYWLYSFMEAEKELVKGIDFDGGKRKQLHRTMKMLNTDEWSNTSKPIISSYILKNVWFWECEKYPWASQWDNDHLWTRLESMTRYLLQCIRARKLPQYFYPKVNLLEKKDEDELDMAATKLEKFLGNPFAYLQDNVNTAG